MRTALALALALIGCAVPYGAREPAQACREEGALPKEWLEPGSFVVFGEIHGSRELPAIFAEAVCAAASAGRAVEVGLEQPRGSQARIDTFLASPGATADVAKLLDAPFWLRDYQDGRSSQAQVELLERLRGLRASGLPIHVFPFDIDPGADATEREKAMAESLAAQARAHPQALTMVLVGEVHAWTTAGAPWDPDFVPMGLYLERAGIRVRSLGRATPAGTAWICTGGAATDCGPRQTGATLSLPSGRAAGIERLPERSTRGYDGLYGTPSLTASPPAVIPRKPQPA